MMRVWRLPRAIALAAAVLGVTLFVLAAAEAMNAGALNAGASSVGAAERPPMVQVSTDGVVWRSTVEGDLFPQAVVFAPGVSVGAVLLVRSDTAVRGVRIEVHDRGGGELWRALEVTATAGAAAQGASKPAGSSSVLITTPVALRPGEVEAFSLRFTLPGGADGSSQRLTAHPLLVLHTSAVPGTAGSLAATGVRSNSRSWSAPLVALLLILAGSSICHNRRAVSPPKEDPL